MIHLAASPALRVIGVVLSCVFLHGNATAQTRVPFRNTSYKTNPNNKNVPLRSFTIGFSLFAAGAFTAQKNTLINNAEIREERNEHHPGFSSRADDVLQFGPLAAGFAMGASGDRDRLWHFTKKMLFTEAVLMATVPALKKAANEQRPDTRSFNSFPSGHTAQAFASATLFAYEYGRHKPLLQILAYSSAATVGAMRVMNNRHWTSDVVAGAGLGILSARLSEAVFHGTGGPKHRRPH